MQSMKRAAVLLAGMGLLSAGVPAQYHDPLYLVGGYGTNSTMYWNGIWFANARNRTLKHLTPTVKIYYARTIIMDADNRRVLFTADGTTSSSYSTLLRSGVYRLDPNSLSITTVLMDTMNLYSPRRLVINQDGDYVLGCYQRNPGTNYALLKLTSAGTTLTTILDRRQFGNSSVSIYGVGINMETGNYLVNIYNFPNYYYSVLDVAEDGTFTTFGGGARPNYGWYGYFDNMYQNFDTAAIEGQYYGMLYRLQKGGLSRTTVWNLGYPGTFVMAYTSKFDLESAPAKRLVATGYEWKRINNNNYYAPSVFYVDVKPPYAVTAINCDPQSSLSSRYHYIYGFDFYRGRHIQSVKMGTGKWSVFLSCPSFANKNYVLVMSAAGYRPGIKLPDGRTFHLNYDDFFNLSFKNWLRPYFDPGPGKLNARGEAVGSIDVSAFGKLKMPIWIAMAVLDPQAPSGIAYLPDTYVMRL